MRMVTTVTAFITTCLSKGRGGRCLSVRRSPPTHPGLEGNPEFALLLRQERGWHRPGSIHSHGPVVRSSSLPEPLKARVAFEPACHLSPSQSGVLNLIEAPEELLKYQCYTLAPPSPLPGVHFNEFWVEPKCHKLNTVRYKSSRSFFSIQTLFPFPSLKSRVAEF